MELWSLTQAALEGEPWRLWTGHLAHYDLGHLLVNLVAATLPVTLLGPRLRRAVLSRAFVIAPILSVILLWIGGFDELRGLSGLAVFLWCSGGLLLARNGRLAEGAMLLLAVIGKLVLERSMTVPMGGGEFEVSSAAHAAAALLAIGYDLIRTRASAGPRELAGAGAPGSSPAMRRRRSSLSSVETQVLEMWK